MRFSLGSTKLSVIQGVRIKWVSIKRDSTVFNSASPFLQWKSTLCKLLPVEDLFSLCSIHQMIRDHFPANVRFENRQEKRSSSVSNYIGFQGVTQGEWDRIAPFRQQQCHCGLKESRSFGGTEFK